MSKHDTFMYKGAEIWCLRRVVAQIEGQVDEPDLSEEPERIRIRR
jgi:hypothetical protein